MPSLDQEIILICAKEAYALVNAKILVVKAVIVDEYGIKQLPSGASLQREYIQKRPH